jgi:hypothetical protein
VHEIAALPRSRRGIATLFLILYFESAARRCGGWRKWRFTINFGRITPDRRHRVAASTILISSSVRP